MSKCRYDLSEDCNNRDCLDCVFDKIRAEATSLKISYTDHDKDTYRRGINDVLRLIDKYKAEGSDNG